MAKKAAAKTVASSLRLKNPATGRILHVKNPPPVCFAFPPEARKIELAVSGISLKTKKMVSVKKLIITIASLLIMIEHMVQGQGVVLVSDPGQAQGKLITKRDIVPFVNVALTASNASDQTVCLTVQQSGAASDMDLFTGSFSNKLTGMQTVLGPFVVKSGQTNNIVISARVNSVKATNSSPTVSLDLMTVSNSTPGVVQGTLPIVGTSYIIDTNSDAMVHGVITSITPPIYYNNEYGAYYLLNVTAKTDPLRVYTLEHSTNMVDWEEWLTGIQPAGLTGNFQVDAFLNPTNFPNQGFFRLKSQ